MNTMAKASGLQFTITREALRDGLRIVAGAIAKKVGFPVLGNVLIRSVESGLSFSTTDLDMAITTSVPADVQATGATTLPFAVLHSIAAELPVGAMQVAVVKDRATITCGDARFVVAGITADEFPGISMKASGTPWTIRVADLRKMLEKTMHACSKEASRPIQNGVLLELRKDAIRMVGCDNARLALCELSVGASNESDSDFILPPAALMAACKAFDDAEDLALHATGDHVLLRSAPTCVRLRAIQGPYPHYRQVIPTSHDKECVADREALLAGLRRAEIVAKNGTHCANLHFEADAISCTAVEADVGEAGDKVAASYKGAPVTIWLSANFLIEALRAIPTAQVKLSMSHPERAILILPHMSTEAASLTYLLMPRRDMGQQRKAS